MKALSMRVGGRESGMREEEGRGGRRVRRKMSVGRKGVESWG